MIGMTAVAVPVKDSTGRLMATLSVHAPDQRHSVADLVKFLPNLKAAAVKLSDLHSS